MENSEAARFGLSTAFGLADQLQAADLWPPTGRTEDRQAARPTDCEKPSDKKAGQLNAF